jgi:hypothetical protein
VREHLDEEVVMDLTRKQVAGVGVTWSVRVRDGGAPVRGLAEAVFELGRLRTLRLAGVP